MKHSSGLQELTVEETENVAGGAVVLLGFSMAISSLVGLKIGITTATAMAGIVSLLDQNGLYNRRSLRRISGSTRHSHSNGGGFGSDRRIKRDIHEEGRIDAMGLTVYSWEYINAPGERFVGVMAQDLLARADLKHTVFTFDEGPFSGFYGVDYDALGLRCLDADAFTGDVETLIAATPVLAD